MKKIYLLWSLAIATLMVNVFYACKSDDTLEEFYRKHGLTLNPTQDPDFVIYSNGNVLATTLGTRSETRADATVNNDYFKIGDFGGGKSDWMKQQYPALYEVFDNAPQKTDRDEQVSDAEYKYVIKYIADNQDKGSDKCTINKNYFIQNVSSSYDTYHLAFIQDNGQPHHYTDITGGNHMDYIKFGDVHINDYNANRGPRALCIYDKIPLVSPSYHDSYYNTTQENAFKYYYIEYPENSGTICCYLCFDYRTYKYDNGLLDYKGDGVYNDWVIKIIPADGSTITTPDDPTDPTDPETPVITDEVEVNLSVNDEKEKDDYIATKLSIHIRALTDVEVFIPVKQQYYCDVDDMAIVLSHNLDPNYQYSNPGQKDITNGYTYTYTVAGQYVKDGETKTANEVIQVYVKYEAKGIRVTTQGMTQAALDYLQYTYQDGLTIEVWNYFNSEITTNGTDRIPVTRSDLKPMLDKSTVTFTSDPEYYVNAFAMLYDYQKEGIYVYKGTDGKPYLMNVTLNAEGKVISETETSTLLDRKYWEADSEGNFVKFVGAKNTWDCTVTPPSAYSVEATHTGSDPEDFNVVYKK